MHILITGGTGFIGAPLVARLVAAGHTITVLTRQALASTDSVSYIASLDQIDDGEKVEAIINLAGASLAAKRWTEAYKDNRKMIESQSSRGPDTTSSYEMLQEYMKIMSKKFDFMTMIDPIHCVENEIN